MEKEILHKHFKGETTVEEDQAIIDWIEASDNNRQAYMSEQKQWFASLHPDHSHFPNVGTKHKKIPAKRIMWEIASITAVLLFTIIMLRSYFLALPSNEQKIIIPVGQRANITLPDGTSVWLNSNTTLTYPTGFSKDKREVILQGEAFFEVAEDEKCPFIVRTQKYDIEVHGTAFNVYSYSGKAPFNVTLVKGSVKINDQSDKNKNISLKPGHKAFVSDNKLAAIPVGKHNNHAWRDGILLFNDEPIENVIEQLSAYYDKKIVLHPEIGTDFRYTGKFLHNDSLEYILRYIQNDLQCQIQNDEANNCIVLKREGQIPSGKQVADL